MATKFYDHLRLKDRFNKRGLLLITKAINLKDLSAITKEDLNIQERTSGVEKLIVLMDDFTGKVVKVPDSDNTEEYDEAVEENARLLVEYVSINAVKALKTKITQSQVDTLCSPKIYNPQDPFIYLNIIKSWGKLWSRFNVDFLKAVSVKMQVAVDKRDRYSGLNLTENDISLIEIEVRKVGYLTSVFSKQTSKREYIENTTISEKRRDAATFRMKISKASNLVRIVNTSLEDIPVTEIFESVSNFELNPGSKALKRILENQILAYKSVQIAACIHARDNDQPYVFDEHFNSK